MPGWVTLLIQAIIAIAQAWNRQPPASAPLIKYQRYVKRADKYERILNITREK